MGSLRSGWSARPVSSSESSSLSLPLQSLLRQGFTARHWPLLSQLLYRPSVLGSVSLGPGSLQKTMSQTPLPAGCWAGSSNGKKWLVAGKARRGQKVFFFFLLIVASLAVEHLQAPVAMVALGWGDGFWSFSHGSVPANAPALSAVSRPLGSDDRPPALCCSV